MLLSYVFLGAVLEEVGLHVDLLLHLHLTTYSEARKTVMKSSIGKAQYIPFHLVPSALEL